MSEDQKAMLRLLAQREEGYEDIAALLGLSVGEVRAKVKDALTELDSSDAPAPAPEPVAPAPEPPSPPQPAPDPVERKAAPKSEPAPAPPAPSRPGPKASSSRPRPSLPRDRRRLIEIGVAALVAILLVLFATGAVDVGGGDDSGSDTPTEAVGQTSGEVTQAVLAPPDGGDAIGQAVFGKVGKKPVLLVQAKGLEPSSEGESYTIWLYRSAKVALRVGAVKVGDEGVIAAQFPVPIELLSYVSAGAFNQIYISRTEDAAYAAEIAQAKEQKRLPSYSGTTVLSGSLTGPLAER